ncbi:D-TA family PLP-dependent enzyme [Lentiprolixibacter aurantiacus]|uniref:D-TA family PLP-dependent enzyme n=1 Tax=Lentiprolixibacter aurantiacus TaxID=2993939 RepID=A0AAE3MIH0_9FLAO|nr:D-TA family PLP-dependent enzyme [Lentiprolixibacter aurantiacus]MCX2718188.1 D-TA family PLP-dependent enzyme [Lentiprolixibacter aurantiacus]
MDTENWYELKDTDQLVTPCLLVYPDRISKNIERMVEIAGTPSRLRPHIKTHKTAEIIQMQMDKGINQFKCATIAEAELLGNCKAPDVLLAMQPVGFNIVRLFNLIETFPETRFSALVDCMEIREQLEQEARKRHIKLGIYLDLNTGMNRTGIIPGNKALELYRSIWGSENLEAEGLHAYDGHIRNTDFEERRTVCKKAFEPVQKLKEDIEREGMSVKFIIAGGSPSFPVHALNEEVITSPGTTLLWDARYESLFPEMKMLTAAVLCSRVISRPAPNVICLDLGHKALAPEMPFPRVELLDIDNCRQISQSEEHLVLECSDPEQFQIGDVVYAIPMHICPTVAKYRQLITVSKGKVTGSWKVAARDHQLTI